MPGFLAYIVPVDSGNVPTHPIVIPPGSPPGIWGGGNVPMPTPPIYFPPGGGGGGGPPGIWGGGNVPMPTPPIANVPGAGGPPLVIWGPNDPRPENPIVIVPPGSMGPGVPTHPIYIPVYPAHPIVLPPEGGGGEPPQKPELGVEVKVGWTAETGWVVVLVPTGPHPTPSR